MVKGWSVKNFNVVKGTITIEGDDHNKERR